MGFNFGSAEVPPIYIKLRSVLFPTTSLLNEIQWQFSCIIGVGVMVCNGGYGMKFPTPIQSNGFIKKGIDPRCVVAFRVRTRVSKFR